MIKRNGKGMWGRLGSTGLVVLSAVAVGAGCAQAADNNCQPSFVVLPFAPPSEFTHNTQYKNWRGLSDKVREFTETALVRRGASVLSRQELQALNDEKALELQGVVGQAAAFGKALGGDYVLCGSINVEEKTVKVPIVGIKYHEVKVTCDVRVINVETTAIVAALSGSAKDRGLDGKDLPDIFMNEIDNGNVSNLLRKAAESMAKDFPTNLPCVARKSGGPAAGIQPVSLTGKVEVPESLKRRRLMVVLPEYLIEQRPVPDPAGETAIIKALLSAGLSVYDDKRVKELLVKQYEKQIRNRDVSEQFLAELRDDYGVDLIVVGEAIAQSPDRQSNGYWVSRGRVEFRLVETATAKIIATDGVHKTGTDLTEVLAAKAAFRDAGEEAGRILLSALVENGPNAAGPAQTRTTEMVIGGWGNLLQADKFVTGLASVAGVSHARRVSFRGGVLTVSVEAGAEASDSLDRALMTHPAVRSFRIQIETSVEGRIEGSVSAASIAAGSGATGSGATGSHPAAKAPARKAGGSPKAIARGR